MSRPVNELRDLVLRRLDALGEGGRPLSFREAAERSRGLLTRSTIHSIATGKHSNRIDDKTAQGLAAFLDIPLDDVYVVAKLPRPGSRWILPTRFDRLSEPRRRLVEEVAANLLDLEERVLRGG